MAETGEFGVLEVVEGINKQLHPLKPGFCVIGKGVDVNVRLIGEKIQDIHCIVQVHGNGVATLMPQSDIIYPTKLNNRVIRKGKNEVLKPGDAILIDGVKVLYKNDTFTEQEVQAKVKSVAPRLFNTPRRSGIIKQVSATSTIKKFTTAVSKFKPAQRRQSCASVGNDKLPNTWDAEITLESLLPSEKNISADTIIEDAPTLGNRSIVQEKVSKAGSTTPSIRYSKRKSSLLLTTDGSCGSVSNKPQLKRRKSVSDLNEFPSKSETGHRNKSLAAGFKRSEITVSATIFKTPQGKKLNPNKSQQMTPTAAFVTTRSKRLSAYDKVADSPKEISQASNIGNRRSVKSALTPKRSVSVDSKSKRLSSTPFGNSLVSISTPNNSIVHQKENNFESSTISEAVNASETSFLDTTGTSSFTYCAALEKDTTTLHSYSKTSCIDSSDDEVSSILSEKTMAKDESFNLSGVKMITPKPTMNSRSSTKSGRKSTSGVAGWESVPLLKTYSKSFNCEYQNEATSTPKNKQEMETPKSVKKSISSSLVTQDSPQPTSLSSIDEKTPQNKGLRNSRSIQKSGKLSCISTEKRSATPLMTFSAFSSDGAENPETPSDEIAIQSPSNNSPQNKKMRSSRISQKSDKRSNISTENKSKTALKSFSRNNTPSIRDDEIVNLVTPNAQITIESSFNHTTSPRNKKLRSSRISQKFEKRPNNPTGERSRTPLESFAFNNVSSSSEDGMENPETLSDEITIQSFSNTSPQNKKLGSSRISQKFDKRSNNPTGERSRTPLESFAFNNVSSSSEDGMENPETPSNEITIQSSSNTSPQNKNMRSSRISQKSAKQSNISTQKKSMTSLESSSKGFNNTPSRSVGGVENTETPSNEITIQSSSNTSSQNKKLRSSRISQKFDKRSNNPTGERSRTPLESFAFNNVSSSSEDGMENPETPSDEITIQSSSNTSPQNKNMRSSRISQKSAKQSNISTQKKSMTSLESSSKGFNNTPSRSVGGVKNTETPSNEITIQSSSNTSSQNKKLRSSRISQKFDKRSNNPTGERSRTPLESFAFNNVSSSSEDGMENPETPSDEITIQSSSNTSPQNKNMRNSRISQKSAKQSNISTQKKSMTSLESSSKGFNNTPSRSVGGVENTETPSNEITIQSSSNTSSQNKKLRSSRISQKFDKRSNNPTGERSRTPLESFAFNNVSSSSEDGMENPETPSDEVTIQSFSNTFPQNKKLRSSRISQKFDKRSNNATGERSRTPLESFAFNNVSSSSEDGMENPETPSDKITIQSSSNTSSQNRKMRSSRISQKSAKQSNIPIEKKSKTALESFSNNNTASSSDDEIVTPNVQMTIESSSNATSPQNRKMRSSRISQKSDKPRESFSINNTPSSNDDGIVNLVTPNAQMTIESSSNTTSPQNKKLRSCRSYQKSDKRSNILTEERSRTLLESFAFNNTSSSSEDGMENPETPSNEITIQSSSNTSPQNRKMRSSRIFQKSAKQSNIPIEKKSMTTLMSYSKSVSTLSISDDETEDTNTPSDEKANKSSSDTNRNSPSSTTSSSPQLMESILNEKENPKRSKSGQIKKSCGEISDDDNGEDGQDDIVTKVSDNKRKKKISKSPKNDLTDVRGVKRLVKTPKVNKSPANSLTDFRGVKRLITTPTKQNSPKNDLSDVKGLKKIIKTPKEVKNDLTNVPEFKQIFEKPPKNDLSDVKGIKGIFKTPKMRRSPKNDLTNVPGFKQIFTLSKSSNLDDLEGISELMATPAVTVRRGRTPKSVKSSKIDKKLSNTATVSKDSKSEILNSVITKTDNGVLSVKRKRGKTPKNDYTDVGGVKRMFAEEEAALRNISNTSGVSELFNTSSELFTAVFNKKPLRKYPSKSPNRLSKIEIERKSVDSLLEESTTSPDVADWVETVNKELATNALGDELPSTSNKDELKTPVQVLKRSNRIACRTPTPSKELSVKKLQATSTPNEIVSVKKSKKAGILKEVINRSKRTRKSIDYNETAKENITPDQSDTASKKVTFEMETQEETRKSKRTPRKPNKLSEFIFDLQSDNSKNEEEQKETTVTIKKPTKKRKQNQKVQEKSENGEEVITRPTRGRKQKYKEANVEESDDEKPVVKRRGEKAPHQSEISMEKIEGKSGIDDEVKTRPARGRKQKYKEANVEESDDEKPLVKRRGEKALHESEISREKIEEKSGIDEVKTRPARGRKQKYKEANVEESDDEKPVVKRRGEKAVDESDMIMEKPKRGRPRLDLSDNNTKTFEEPPQPKQIRTRGRKRVKDEMEDNTKEIIEPQLDVSNNNTKSFKEPQQPKQVKTRGRKRFNAEVEDNTEEIIEPIKTRRQKQKIEEHEENEDETVKTRRKQNVDNSKEDKKSGKHSKEEKEKDETLDESKATTPPKRVTRRAAVTKKTSSAGHSEPKTKRAKKEVVEEIAPPIRKSARTRR